MDSVFASIGQWFWTVISTVYANLASLSITALLGLLAVSWIVAIIFRIFARGSGSLMRLISSILVGLASLLSVIVVVGIIANLTSGAANDFTAFTNSI
ncbi:hypothetical protein [Bifidobacterium aquikefiri]|uniref:Uncharacterized protein n=1 Tax=Bifidobacterium aquikefiri TaxID=1653207 RepID=A0A261G729_9BIFI|nr:hypothetical protein [Bifidobacterium aquikefiri]OZG67218.1 hypothetical protein BAQU_1291 [Bifidobacterium aquikefiri]